MWKSDDEESNLLESVVSWAHPTPPTPIRSSTSAKTVPPASISPGAPTPPLPPPSPFSELFPQELLQSSGLLLSQFDDDVMTPSTDHQRPDSVVSSEARFRRSADGHRENESASDHSSSPMHPSTTAEYPPGVETTDSSGVYRCVECKFSTDDRRLFMCHKRSKHAGEKTFSCPDCSAKFTRQYSLKKHVLQKHPTICASPASQLPKYCPFPNCKYSTRNPISMQLHKRTHQQLYFCKECNARYTRRQSLLGHLTKHHGSNAALIGMRPSPAIVNVVDEQSLQSPPPPSTTVPSSLAAPFFQQNGSLTTDADGSSNREKDDQAGDSQTTKAAAFSHEEGGHSSSAGNGNAKCSPPFAGSDAASESINAVVGSVVATVAAGSQEPLDTKFYCDKCQFTAVSLRRLYAHKLSYHRGPKEKMMAKASHQMCPHCPRKFASLKRMLTHVKKIHTASIKKQRKRPSRNGGKQRRQSSKRRPPMTPEMSCGQCGFASSRKRIFAAHMKSHATENLDRNQDSKHDSQSRKSVPVVASKRFSPDRNLDGASTAAMPVVNSPSYASAVSPSAYDIYHSGASARHNGSGSSTHSNNSTGEILAANGGNFGQFFVLNRNSSSSTNSFSSDHSAPNGRLIRLDLNSQSTSGFDEMAACLQGLQQANGALMQLLRRRENELRSLRSNVVELLRLLLPNHQAFHHVLTLDNVDETVSSALSRILTDSQK